MLVDVAGVPRGRDCGCICPSCETSLIARQGEVKEWHFAHRSRGVYSETKKECDYSFDVSVRLMLRQIAIHGLNFLTPNYSGVVQAYSELSQQHHARKFNVTEGRIVRIEEPLVGVAFAGTEVDVLGKVSGYPFAIYVTYKGRDLPCVLRSPEDCKCGIIEVNLSGVARRFQQEKHGQLSSVNYLGRFSVN